MYKTYQEKLGIRRARIGFLLFVVFQILHTVKKFIK